MEGTHSDKADFFRDIMLKRLENGHSVTFPVQGISMLPVLQEGDMAVIEKREHYFPGDILVFLYGNEGLLVHRLLKTKGNRYFCKGDNCFRIETVGSADICGKVTAVSRGGSEYVPGAATRRQLRMSYRVNRVFCRCGCDVERTKKSAVYKRYRQAYLEFDVS